jgi:hypothetical protein
MTISDEGVRGSRRDHRRHVRGGFRMPPPPLCSDTTGVGYEHMSSRPVSMSACWPCFMVSALVAVGAVSASWRIATHYFHTCL